MRSHKQGDKPSKNTIAMPTPTTGNEVDVLQQEHSRMVGGLIETWSKQALFESVIPGNFVEKVMRCYSDKQLQMPLDFYKELCQKAIEHPGDCLWSFHEANALFQIIPLCSAKDLEMELLDYLAMRETLDYDNKLFQGQLEANKQRIREENPYIGDMPVNMVGEA